MEGLHKLYLKLRYGHNKKHLTVLKVETLAFVKTTYYR
jgi:hypothetical protein